MALEQQGLRVPGDVSVVGFDDVQWMSMVDPPLTTVRQPLADMARTAAELMLRRLREGREGRPSTVVFGPSSSSATRSRRSGRQGSEDRLRQMRVTIGLDVGTTGARAVGVDEHGGSRPPPRPSTRCSRPGHNGRNKTPRVVARVGRCWGRSPSRAGARATRSSGSD